MRRWTFFRQNSASFMRVSAARGIAPEKLLRALLCKRSTRSARNGVMIR